MIRKNTRFEVKDGVVFTIGRNKTCTLCLDDDRCAPINAILTVQQQQQQSATSSLPSPLDLISPRLTLHAENRMYRLVGLEVGRSGGISAPLSLGSVIKLGSVSLKVTVLCAEQDANFMKRFDSEIHSAFDRVSVRCVFNT